LLHTHTSPGPATHASPTFSITRAIAAQTHCMHGSSPQACPCPCTVPGGRRPEHILRPRRGGRGCWPSLEVEGSIGGWHVGVTVFGSGIGLVKEGDGGNVKDTLYGCRVCQWPRGLDRHRWVPGLVRGGARGGGGTQQAVEEREERKQRAYISMRRWM
ncbi:hypothetical protein BC826DRAFT_1053399, partial [Russula brevipes]